MPIQDKIAAAKKISELLNTIFAAGDFRLRYKITVDPQVGADREWERPEILVELSGADSPLVLENGGELLRAFEHVSLEMLRLAPTSTRRSTSTARTSAPPACRSFAWRPMSPPRRVRETSMPYAFAPMSSRERRILHLALRDMEDLRTESAGEAAQRHVVVYPKDYKGTPPAPPISRRRR